MTIDLGLLSRGDAGSSALFSAGLSALAARRDALSAGAPGRPAVLAHEGLHQIVVTELGRWRLLLNSDGLGTKTEVAERVERYDTLAFDLLAMLVDDAVRFGAEPLSLSNVLDIHTADGTVIEGLARGLEAAARAAEVAVVGGEVAELGARIGGRGASGGLCWSGTLLSLLAPGRELTGAALRPGDALVAIREPGLRCNGFTQARAILSAAHGEAWHAAPTPFGGTFGEALLTPSTIYAPALLDLLGRASRGDGPRAPISALVHVTGGGVPGKLGRVLRARGLGARLDDLFAPGPALAAVLALSTHDDGAAYRAFNMGQGMLVATPAPDAVLAALAARGLEAKRAGVVTDAREIRIVSRGRAPGAELVFSLDGGAL